MDRNTIIAELTAADVTALPDVVTQAVIAAHEKSNETQSRIAELESVNETLAGERDTAQQRIAELETQVAEQTRAAFAHEIEAKVAELLDWNNVTGDEAKTKLGVLKKNFTVRVVAELNGDHSTEKLDTTVAELWDSEYKILAETMRDVLAGPSALVGGAPRNKSLAQTLLEEFPQPGVDAQPGQGG